MPYVSIFLRKPALQFLLISLAAGLAAGPCRAQTSNGISLRAVRGDFAFNDPTAAQSQAIAIEVTTSDGKPVSGATVLFESPEGEPTILFNGRHQATASTDLSGIATAPLASAKGEGMVRIAITAAASGKTATLLVRQRNQIPTVAVAKDTLEVLPADEKIEIPLIGNAKGQYKGSKSLRARVLLNGKPAAGATVEYEIQVNPVGAHADFGAGGSPVAKAVTDQNGIATSPEMIANSQDGSFLVNLRAQLKDLIATKVVTVTNVRVSGGK